MDACTEFDFKLIISTTLESRNPYPKKALFVGTYQAKRYNSVIQLKKKLSDIGITTTIKIRIPYYYYVKQKLKGVKLDKKFLIFEDIGLSEILNLYQSSDIIIDAASEYQTGLTMRTFEALGSNKILLTNNYAIKQEDFFNSNYIKFFDENFSCQNFVNHEYRIHIEEHRIDNWIIKLVGT